MRLFAIIITILLLQGCYQQKETYISPPGYDLQKPYIINLPADLDEISGLTYYAKDKSVFGIGDENGVLYKITPGAQSRINNWKFSKKGDYEELVLHDSTFYIMKSNGDIDVVNFTHGDSINMQQIRFPFGKGNEFEAMYYNDSINKIILICKDCDQDKKKSLTTFTFNPATFAYSDSSFSIDVKSLAEKMGIKKMRFKPSAAAVNPLTGELFIISSINKLLLIMDKQHNIKSFFRLNPGLYKQPEGITFSEKGTMIISNESAKVGTANLLIYNYSK